jgi:hypothetical protein
MYILETAKSDGKLIILIYNNFSEYHLPPDLIKTRFEKCTG